MNERDQRQAAFELSMANMRANREQMQCPGCRHLADELIEMTRTAFLARRDADDLQAQLKRTVEIYAKREAMRQPAPIVIAEATKD